MIYEMLYGERDWSRLVPPRFPIPYPVCDLVCDRPPPPATTPPAAAAAAAAAVGGHDWRADGR